MSKLTSKQELFCQEFVKTGNASDAYRKSYSTSKMKDKSINELASTLLRNIKVSSRVKELQKILEEKHDISKDKIINELGNIAFFDIRNLFNEAGEFIPPHELSENAGRAIASVKSTTRHFKDGEKETTMEYKLNNKNTSIDQLNKMLSYYINNNDNQDKDITIVIE